ncbi:MAG: response regulator [Bacteroidetes bacterium]|nr:response regulator [Bacteroidota bacterium]
MKDILIVDDDTTIHVLVGKRLTKAGYQCHFAYNAQQGINILKTRRINLVITDILMPGEGGFSFIESVKADKVITKIPMIVISSLPPNFLESEGKKLGGVDYVTKPIDFDKLESLVFLNISNQHTIPDDSLEDLELRRKKQKVINKIAESSKSENQAIVANVLVNAILQFMGCENVSFWVKTPDTTDDEGKMVKLAHAGVFGYELPMDEIEIHSQDALSELLHNKSGILTNNAFRSARVINETWAKEIGLICEAVFPVFDVKEKVFLMGSNIDYAQQNVFGVLVSHKSQLMTEAEFEIMEKLVRQMSAILAHVYRMELKKDKKGSWDNLLD